MLKGTGGKLNCLYETYKKSEVKRSLLQNGQREEEREGLEREAENNRIHMEG